MTDILIQGQKVADSGRRLLAEGLVARTWGNVSCRTGEDSFVITPSGLGYEHMKAEDVVKYSMLDGSWEGTRKPSSEKGIHAAAYARFPEVNFVIHTHQSFGTALGMAGFDRLCLSEEDENALGGIAVAKYGIPSTKTLAKNVEKAFAGGAHTVLMAHHGCIFAGKDEDEAFEMARLLERLCKAACAAQLEREKDETAEKKLAELSDDAAGFTELCSHPAALKASKSGTALYCELDDMAQMVGVKIPCVAPDKAAVQAALKKHGAVLVKGLGAVCAADTNDDAQALAILVEKSCICALHCRELGVNARLSAPDTLLQRFVYKQKYSKKKDK